METLLNTTWLVLELRLSLLNEIGILRMKCGVENSCIDKRLGKWGGQKWSLYFFCCLCPCFYKIGHFIFEKRAIFLYGIYRIHIQKPTYKKREEENI